MQKASLDSVIGNLFFENYCIRISWNNICDIPVDCIDNAYD